MAGFSFGKNLTLFGLSDRYFLPVRSGQTFRPLRLAIRNPLLYPLSYGGVKQVVRNRNVFIKWVYLYTWNLESCKNDFLHAACCRN